MKRLVPRRRLPDVQRRWVRVIWFHLTEPFRLLQFLAGPLLAVLIGAALVLVLVYGP